MSTTPIEFYAGGINSPQEFNLFVLNNTAQFFFWDTWLDGMAERSWNESGKYYPPVTDQYANGCFPLIGFRVKA